ncbi:heterokaryon incompatibility protein-domain-containing protein [Acrodontium crateriforme]|uniref:Heterokaryon incompatibility protein-domain-containing protein n=1 Tax=Acrodontium crateriforme TaxID=150365 RepID=A0AAQ3R567_9PEZI|nr:heterokaryon incompatibility protein-domain-containing protein [Acrodontium crateriforme]
MDPASYLPLTRGQFRLLKISPAPLLADPIIRLETFSFEDAPLYVALSYTWGDNAETFGPVLCLPGGQRVFVRKNLYTALLRCQTDLRMNNISWVWVDALCINQHDPVDKATQIPLMDQIFDKADHVIVWLGVGTILEEKALERMSSLAKAIQSLIQMKSQVTWFQALSMLPNIFPTPDELDFWHAFMEIIAKPWFNRTWVVQEACTHTSMTLILGDSTSISFQDLSDVTWKPSRDAQKSLSKRLALRYNYDLEQIQRARPRKLISLVQKHFADLLSAFSDLANLRALKDSSSAIFTHYMYRAFRGRECTLEEDRLYAMIGVMKPTLKAGITVDLLRSVRDTYLIAARHWWLNDPELSFLHWIHSDHVDKISRLWLPSWCLDFSFMENYPIVFSGIDSDSSYGAGLGKQRQFQTQSPRKTVSMITQARPPLPLKLRDIPFWRGRSVEFGHKGSLRVSAIFADTVSNVVAPTTFPYVSWRGFLEDKPNKSDVRDALRWLDECENLSKHTLGDEGLSDAFWRTMVINKRNLAKQSSHSTDVFFEDERRPSYLGVREAFRTDIGRIRQLRDDRHAYFEDLGTTLEYVFFATTGGRIGRASGSIQAGDEVVIFHGAKTPFLLRRVRGTSDLYKLVAELYVHGLMQGEVFEPESKAYMKEYIII